MDVIALPNLGLALEADGADDKAFDAFYKSTWSAETQSAGFFWLACLASRKGRFEEALEYIDKSLIRNWHNMKARALKAAFLRKLTRGGGAFVEESLAIDPLYMGCLYEQSLLTGDAAAWKKAMREEAHNYLELSLDYIKAGLYHDAAAVLNACPDSSPMVSYYSGYVCTLMGRQAEAAAFYQRAESACPDYCFPNRVEELKILEAAISALNAAPMAHYYSGCLLYDKKQYEKAAGHWEAALSQKPEIATACRNLAIYYYNKRNDGTKAMEYMEKACALDGSYPRLWLEYDQLAAKLNTPVRERLAVMESHPEITAARDDLYLRYITLLNCSGRCKEALSSLLSRRFHPWEGGEGKVSAQYKYALISLAVEKLKENKPEKALELLTRTLIYPENLGEGKLPNVPDNEAHYYMGIACRMMGEPEKAHAYFKLAAAGSDEPQSVHYYNDQPSDYIFFQGLAWRELGKEDAARKAFHRLTAFGEKHLFDRVTCDFFAVSLPEIEVFQDDMALRNTQYCSLLRALGALGLGRRDEARKLAEGIVRQQSDFTLSPMLRSETGLE